jgi:hypothetical protein
MVKVLLILVVFAILMEDGSSIKKSEEEKREEKELAELVNKTLAEEEKKKAEEEKKKMTDGVKDGKQEDETERATVEKQEGQDEACPPANYTCPIVEPCPEVKDCPPQRECKPCAPCPTVICPNQTCLPCRPCNLCPVCNRTATSSPPVCRCPEDQSQAMTIPVAMAVGAGAALLVSGVLTVIGLVVRYVSPTVSGFLFVAVIILVWYLSSQYPETARELGRRVWTTLQEAMMTLGHQVMEALQRHQDQVGVPAKLNLFFRMSSMFFI